MDQRCGRLVLERLVLEGDHAAAALALLGKKGAIDIAEEARRIFERLGVVRTPVVPLGS